MWMEIPKTVLDKLQYLTTLMIKIFFLRSSWNFPCSKLCLLNSFIYIFIFFLLLCTSEKSLAQLGSIFVSSDQVAGDSIIGLPWMSSTPVWTKSTLSTASPVSCGPASGELGGPWLDLLQYACVFLALAAQNWTQHYRCASPVLKRGE